MRGNLNVPLDSWSQSNLYSNYLDDGRVSARFKQREWPGQRPAPLPTKPVYSIFFCTVLLLCGDVHLNP